MEKHEEKLLRDSIITAMQAEIKVIKLKRFIIIENIIFLLLFGGMIWIGIL